MVDKLSKEILCFKKAVLPIEQNSDAFDLSFNRGEILIVTGPDLSGKTSFIKSILGLVSLYEGRIFLFGEDLARLSLSRLQDLRKRTGLVMAKDGLIDSWIIYENLLLPLLYKSNIPKMQRQEKIIEVWEAFGFSESLLWRPVANLNPELRHQVSFVRALVNNPEILLVDSFHPLNIKDAAIEQFIQPYLRNDQATLVINARPSLVQTLQADRCKLAVLMKNKVIAYGNYQQLLKHSSEIVRSWVSREVCLS